MEEGGEGEGVGCVGMTVVCVGEVEGGGKEGGREREGGGQPTA